MKLPKKTNRLCPYCKKQTEQKIVLVSTGHKRGSLKRGSMIRAKLRGRGVGFGNKGKWGSKPAINKWKRTGVKGSKKTTVKYTCKICNKATQQASGWRAKKMEFV